MSAQPARIRYSFREIVEMANEYVRQARESMTNNHPINRFIGMAPANDSSVSKH